MGCSPICVGTVGTKKISRKILFSIVGLILLLGIFLRTWNIGKCGFWTDEIYHAIAAESILKTGQPIFPSGALYTRSLTYTYIVSVFFKYFGVNEAAARTPSILFNFIFLLVGFFVTKCITDSMTALFFLIVMSFSPYCLDLARMCRMYAPFQLFYFIGSMLFFFGYEWNWNCHSIVDKRKLRSIEKKYGINLFFLGLSAFFLFISLTFHELTKSFVITAFSYIILMGAMQWSKDGVKAAVFGKYGLAIFALLLVVVCMFFLSPHYFLNYFHRLRMVSPWTKSFRFPAKYYYWFLSERYSALFFLYPVGFLWLLSEKKKLALFLMCSFIPAIVFFSVVTKLKNTRYIFHLFPFFAIICSFAVSKLVGHIWALSEGCVTRKSEIGLVRNLILVGVMLISINAFSYPWLLNSRRVALEPCQYSDWKAFYEKKGRYIDKDNAVFITTNQNEFYFYFGKKPNFYLSAGYYENRGDAEQFTGASPITNVQELQLVLKHSKTVYLITDNWRFDNQFYVTPELSEFIERNFEKVPLDYLSRIVVYKKKISAIE